jgi:hypothetical protein
MSDRLNTLSVKTIKNDWFLNTFLKSFKEGETSISPKQAEIVKKYLALKYEGIYGSEYEAYINNFKTHITLIDRERTKQLTIKTTNPKEAYVFYDRVFYNLDELKQHLKENHFKSYEELKNDIKHIEYKA